VNVSFPARTATAIIGLSGSGKTTLIDLVSGLLKPESGELVLDGQPMDEAARISLRQYTRYLTHEDFLFDASVADNLRIGNRGVSDDDIWSALERANADGFVKALTKGIETEIGDSGVRLSQGQRQRLCLARALLGRPLLLILDEATSAINPKDEEKIIESLKRLSSEVTIIISSHRPDSVAWVDQVIEIKDGCARKVLAE
jgi:ATP-binding cassette subfamily C protein